MGFKMDQDRAVHVALFATYEPIRLWVKAQGIRAPFCKLALSLRPVDTWSKREGDSFIVERIAEVIETVHKSEVAEKASDLRWVVHRVLNALTNVDKALGWRSPELEAMLADLAEKPWPVYHYFEKLQKKDPRYGIKFLPWISFQPDLTKIGVRISQPGNPDRDVEILSKNGPIWLEDDDFPLAKSKIQSGHFLLLDKDGSTLATVPIDPLDPSALH